jgi:hypothetical protein
VLDIDILKTMFSRVRLERLPMPDAPGEWPQSPRMAPNHEKKSIPSNTHEKKVENQNLILFFVIFNCFLKCSLGIRQ